MIKAPKDGTLRLASCVIRHILYFAPPQESGRMATVVEFHDAKTRLTSHSPGLGRRMVVKPSEAGRLTHACGGSKQRCVATSTFEAEYIALAKASKLEQWFRALLTELQRTDLLGPNRTVRTFSDNQACIAIAEDPVSHRRTKHINTRYDYTAAYCRRKVNSLISTY